ncbi:MAG TPA: hypothetical protein VKH35_13885 [Thermoanaerobaculia bacterium]|nr:hypothetical protein [Thermoanaerobaculia bacterium]
MRGLAILLFLPLACGPAANTPRVSHEPVSVRGWIEDVAGARHGANAELDGARRLQIFQATNVWVDNASYVSGGVAENGSFLLLDVPPGNITITFSAPGAPEANLVLKNIPGNADVFVPGLILGPGTVRVADPKQVTVRLAARVDRVTPTGKTAAVAGLTVPVVEAPMAAMVDRHDYPNPPAGLRPLATVK